MVLERTSDGRKTSGSEWRAGVTHAGYWCDFIEIRGFKIHRLFIYREPDCGGEDSTRVTLGRTGLDGELWPASKTAPG